VSCGRWRIVCCCQLICRAACSAPAPLRRAGCALQPTLFVQTD
jgi:hypothetical protein